MSPRWGGCSTQGEEAQGGKGGQAGLAPRSPSLWPCPFAASQAAACPRETLVCTGEGCPAGWGGTCADHLGAPLTRTEKGPGTDAGSEAWYTLPMCWEVGLFVLIVNDLDLFVRENSKEKYFVLNPGSRWFLITPRTRCHITDTVSLRGRQAEARCSRDPVGAQGFSLWLRSRIA